MAFTTVTHHSAGSNILRSIKSFFVGLILFVISFPILWWNEGRLDVSTVAKTATVITPDGAGGKGEGQLIAVTAGLATDDTVADPDFLKPATHVAIHRKSEMFAWVEHEESHERHNVGGSSDTVREYTYEKTWTDDPQKSSGFEDPEGHENPPFPVDSKDFFAKTAKVGAFVITPSDIELPPTKPLPVDDSMLLSFAPPPAHATPTPGPSDVKPDAKGSAKPHGSAAAHGSASPHGGAAPHASAASVSSAKPAASGTSKAVTKPAGSGSAAPKDQTNNDVAHTNRPVAELHPHRDGTFVYMGEGSNDNPVIGDVRESFAVVDPTPGPVTLYGIRKGNGVTPWIEPGDKIAPAKLYRVVVGTHADAIKLMHGEYEQTTWMIRLIGFFLMWVGLSLTVAPVNAVLSVVPFLGQAGRLLTTLVMFPMALMLTVITVVLSIIAHHPLMLLVPLVLLGGTFALVRVFGKKNAPQPGMPGAEGAYPQGFAPQPGYPPQGGYGGPPPGGGYGPGGGGYGGGGYGGPPPGGGGYGGPPPGGGGYGGPPQGGGGYGGPPPGGGYPQG